MSQKSSLPQVIQFVSEALMPDMVDRSLAHLSHDKATLRAEPAYNFGDQLWRNILQVLNFKGQQV